MKRFVKLSIALGLSAAVFPANATGIEEAIAAWLAAAAASGINWYYVAFVVISSVVSSSDARRKMTHQSEDARNNFNASLQDRSATMLRALPPVRTVYGRCIGGGDVRAIFSSDKNGSRPDGSGYVKADGYKHLVITFADHQCQALNEVYIGGVPIGLANVDANGWVQGGVFANSIPNGQVLTQLINTGSSYTAPSPVTVISAQYGSGAGLDAEMVDGSYTITGTGGVTINNTSGAPLYVAYTIKFGEPWVRVTYVLGTNSQSADANLVSYSGGLWTSNHRLLGHATAFITLDLEQAQFQGGPPAITFDVSGKLCYDPRTTLTVYTRNPALHARDFLLGAHGYDLTSADIDDTYLIAAANACDAQLTFCDLTTGGLITAFNTDGNLEGWTVSGATASVATGVLTLNSTGIDPNLRKGSLSFPGRSGTGASSYTSNAAGYAIGATSIALISGSGTVLAGDKVTFSSDPNIYTVTVGIAAPGTITIASPGLIKALPASAQPMQVVAADNTAVRARIKRVAGSGWEGTCYYTTGGHVESASFLKTIVQPTYDPVTGYAEALFDMSALTVGGTDWTTNTITGIRIDLGTTASDQFLIDWVVVGPMTAATYVCDGQCTTDDDKEQTLREILGTMAGSATYGAKWMVSAGVWTASVMDLSDDDLHGQISMPQSDESLEAIYNGIRGTLILDNASQPSEFDPFSVPSLVTDDGQALWENLTFPFTNNKTRAKNLCAIRVQLNRNGTIISYPAKLRAWPLQVGDRVRVTSSEYGYSLKYFRITDWQFDINSAVVLTMREDYQITYDPPTAASFDPKTDPGLPSPFVIGKLLTPAASSGYSDQLTRSTTLRARVVWSVSTDAYMVNGKVIVKWRRLRVDQDGIFNVVEVPGTDNQAYIGPFAPGDMLIIGIAARNELGQTGPWNWFNHKSETLQLTPLDSTNMVNKPTFDTPANVGSWSYPAQTATSGGTAWAYCLSVSGAQSVIEQGNWSPVTAGEKLFVCSDINANIAGFSCYFGYDWQLGDGSVGGSVYTYYGATNGTIGWQHIEEWTTVPANAVGIRPKLLNNGGSGWGVLFATNLYIGRTVRGATAGTTDTSLVASSGIRLVGNEATKTSGSAGWGEQVYSKESYVGGAFAKMTPVSGSTDIMFGLNSDPLLDADYTSLDYAIQFGGAGGVYIYNNGSYAPGLSGSIATWAALTTYQIVYDGQFVRYLADGAELYKQAAPPGLRLYFDSSFYTSGAKASGISFGPYQNSFNSRAGNLIDASWWAPGVTPTSKWSTNQGSGSDSFVITTLPDGSSGVVWRAVSDNTSGLGGGWNPSSDVTNNFPVDKSKPYMLVSFVKGVSGGNGTAVTRQGYLGVKPNTVCTINTTTPDGNPYVATAPPTNGKWYMHVGWVYPYGTTGHGAGKAGVYDCTTGALVAAGTCYSWANVSASSVRCFQYYANNGAQMDFAWPQVWVCDGSEPSLDDLLSMVVPTSRIADGAITTPKIIDNAATDVVYATSASGSCTDTTGATAFVDACTSTWTNTDSVTRSVQLEYSVWCTKTQAGGGVGYAYMFAKWNNSGVANWQETSDLEQGLNEVHFVALLSANVPAGETITVKLRVVALRGSGTSTTNTYREATLRVTAIKK